MMAAMLFIAAATYAGGGFAPDDVLERRTQFMREYIDYVRRRWHATKRLWDPWEEKDYIAIFFDFDGDGVEEALLDDYYSEYSTPEWELFRRMGPGRFYDTDAKGVIRWPSFKLSICCRPENLYRLVLENGMERMVGLNVWVTEIENPQTRKERQLHGYEDVILSMSGKGEFVRNRIPGGFGDLLRNPAFVRLDRIYPEFYSVSDVVRRPWCWAGCNRMPDSLAARLKPRGGIARPEGFDAFVRRYRDDVRKRTGHVRPLPVHAVFLDADNDGDADVYMSSDAEAVAGGRFRWTLFLNDGGRFERAADTIWFNREARACMESLEPQDVAGKNAFYRIVWLGDPYKPCVALIEDMDGEFHSHTYMRCVPAEERKAVDIGSDEWLGRNEGRLGFVVPHDFLGTLKWLWFVRLERLPCETFHEDVKATASSMAGHDPSMVALSNDVGYANGKKTFLERYRILTDLNHDGTNDLILSEAEDSFGNSGGCWSVFLNSNGFWQCIGTVNLNPSAVTFEATYKGVDLWYYGHCSCRSGTVGYYRFADGKLEPERNTCIFVEAGANDDYEETIFGRIYRAIFHGRKSHPFVMERSMTSTNGTVNWKAVKK